MHRRTILGVLCLASLAAPAWCAEPQSTPAASAPTTTTTATTDVNATDLETLKQKIAVQQDEIKKLQQAMEEQQKMLEQSLQTLNATAKQQQAAATARAAAPSTSDGTSVVTASTTSNSNVAGPVRLVPALGGRSYGSGPSQSPQTSSASPCESDNPGATYVRLGSTCIVPIGFMDATGLWRDKNAGSGIGTNFAGIPYSSTAGANVTNAQNSEFRFSPQNSRLGLRVDGDWKGAHFIGYNEFDFLGTSGTTNLGVTNGAFVPRLRLFWVDVTKDKWEFLGGQSWSMLTPNRVGISPLPGNIFYSQVMDVNYMAGLTWTRQPGFRVVYHPSTKVAFGVAAENPDQYIGGSGGLSASAVTLPSATALSGLAGTQLDNATGTLNTVTVAPDIIAKIAVDPSSRLHFEVAGIERDFRIWNPATGSAPGAGQHFSTVGGGVQAGINAEVFKGFRLITTNYWSDGGGRYLFGQAPDLIVRSNGSLSLIHAGGTVDGFEATIHKNFLLFAYYGGIFIGRDVALDTTGKPIGYGYVGASASVAVNQNRSIQEGTIGFNQTIWKSARYGGVNFIGQYEYATRNPWVVVSGNPSNAHDNTIYFDIRYTLPGSIPTF